MKGRIINLLLVLSSLFGYLEWGTNSHAFLFQAEVEVLYKLVGQTASVIHPFILLPIAGQIILLMTLFWPKNQRFLTYLGIAGIGVLLGFMFIIGCLSLNYKIVLSTVPFLVLAVWSIKYHRQQALFNS
jgi:hypothetical protein